MTKARARGTVLRMIEIETSANPPRSAAAPARDLMQAMLRGWRRKCPSCGQGALYGKYLKVADTCAHCGTELHHQRADDAPPYFVMLVTGHIVIAGVMTLESWYEPPLWVHVAIWGPVLLLMSLWLLPRIKGALIGLQWAFRMHGFGGAKNADIVELPPAPRTATET